MSEVLSPAYARVTHVEHPVEILRKEHELLLQAVADLKTATAALALAGTEAAADLEEQVRSLTKILKEGESHYFREENCLFPALEAHGITDPPAVMWTEHDQIREVEKRIFSLVPAEGSIPQSAQGDLAVAVEELAALMETHYFKENRILFTMALRVVVEAEWKSMIGQFAEIGFWMVMPEKAVAAEVVAAEAMDGMVKFGGGSVPVATLEAILNALPVEITFVDHEDRVRYFNQTAHRIFERSTAAIGRQVHHCHPQKSVHLVEQILKEFKAGTRDTADFWLEMGGSFLVVRFFAVRGKDGSYLGCMEVTQDATGIRSLEGEKRLL